MLKLECFFNLGENKGFHTRTKKKKKKKTSRRVWTVTVWTCIYGVFPSFSFILAKLFKEILGAHPQ